MRIKLIYDIGAKLLSILTAKFQKVGLVLFAGVTFF